MTANDQLYRWQFEEPYKEKGVLIACDEEQSWLLPWWWEHYQTHNTLPVTLVDLGLSPKMQKWALGKMQVIPFNVSFSLASESSQAPFAQAWEEIYGPNVLKMRQVWFKKPFALLHTPYHHTLWLDVDCEVLNEVSFLYDKYEGASLVLSRETEQAQFKESNWLLEDEVLYNSGVILYEHKHPAIIEWAKWCAEFYPQFLGDQQVLSRLIHSKRIKVQELDPDDHWRLAYGIPWGASIVHWTGNWGKAFIRQYGGWQFFKQQSLKGSFPRSDFEKLFWDFK